MTSPLHVVADGQFNKILSDRKVPLASARRLILCTGKIYYDLLDARRKRKIKNTPIMRFEQLYPLSIDEVNEAIDGLPDGCEVVWAQDEPENMGAWPYVKLKFYDELAKRFKVTCVTRVESASPSTGSMAAHKLEQADLIDATFAGLGGKPSSDDG